tara:strand:- start:35 stop:211 length:177 start_codon:yes stop_codon:yes gene_type:complete
MKMVHFDKSSLLMRITLVKIEKFLTGTTKQSLVVLGGQDLSKTLKNKMGKPLWGHKVL